MAASIHSSRAYIYTVGSCVRRAVPYRFHEGNAREKSLVIIQKARKRGLFIATFDENQRAAGMLNPKRDKK